MNQLSLIDALEARDRALASVSENAELRQPGFGDRAAEFVVEYLRTHGTASGEDITDAAKAAGITAHDDRAFGSVFMRLARQKRIVKSGYCARRKGHGTAGGIAWMIKDG